MRDEPSQPVDGRCDAFADALRDAVRRRGLTLKELRDVMVSQGTPVAVSTLSYWTNSRALPSTARSLDVVRGLEHALGVPTGHLVGHLPSDAVSRWESVLMAPFTERVRMTLSAMDLWPINGCRAVFTYDSVDIPDDLRGQVETTRQVLRCETEGTDRFPLVQEIGEDQVPLVVAGSGCHLGRVVAIPEEALFVAELVLPRPLHAGQLHWVDYQMVWDIPVQGLVGLTRVLPRSLHAFVMDGQSPTAGIEPYYCLTPYQADRSDSPATVREHLSPAPYLQMSIEHPVPGTHELAWRMP